MYCLFSKKEKNVPQGFSDYVFFKSGSTHFLIVNDKDIIIPDNWHRVSTSNMKKFAFRDATEWVEPNNSTTGRKRIKEIENDWYQSFKG